MQGNACNAAQAWAAAAMAAAGSSDLFHGKLPELVDGLSASAGRRSSSGRGDAARDGATRAGCARDPGRLLRGPARVERQHRLRAQIQLVRDATGWRPSAGDVDAQGQLVQARPTGQRFLSVSFFFQSCFPVVFFLRIQ